MPRTNPGNLMPCEIDMLDRLHPLHASLQLNPVTSSLFHILPDAASNPCRIFAHHRFVIGLVGTTRCAASHNVKKCRDTVYRIPTDDFPIIILWFGCRGDSVSRPEDWGEIKRATGRSPRQKHYRFRCQLLPRCSYPAPLALAASQRSCLT
jgi:hypothetical protein